MSQELHRHQLVELVTRIANSAGTEEEINKWIELVDANVPHPAITDLIFHPDEEMTPEQIVDRALPYQPIRL